MTSERVARSLILDTALGACTVVVAEGVRVLAHRSEIMARGHQERLGGLVRETMRGAHLEYASLEAIGVTVGPGSFTGLRVGLAFAQGLGLALGRPVLGLSTLEALAEQSPNGTAVGVIDARRGQVYWQAFVDGVALAPPEALDLAAARERVLALGVGAVLVGTGAPLVAAGADVARIIERPAPSPEALARLMARGGAGPAAPLYLRPPDAKLPGGAAPP